MSKLLGVLFLLALFPVMFMSVLAALSIIWAATYWVVLVPWSFVLNKMLPDNKFTDWVYNNEP